MVDFQYFLNRTGAQGIQGLPGEKGDDGKTPVAREGTNTSTTYTVIFDSGDGNIFETANLRPTIEDRGGTTLRYDRDEDVQYLGEPTGANLSGQAGIVYLAGLDRVEANNVQDTDAVAYELFDKAMDDLDGRLDNDEEDISQAKSDIVNLDNRVTTAEGNITSLGSTKADKSTTYTKTETNSLLTGKANVSHTHTISQITNAGSLAAKNTVDYVTEVTNKPTIPTVGNGTITITQGGVSKGTFTTNQSGNTTISLDAGGGGGTTYTAGSGIDITSDVISVDNTVVKTSGAQSISGTKTFTNNLGIETASKPSIVLGITGTNCNVELVNEGASAQPRFILGNIGSSYQRFEVVDENLDKIGDLAYTSDIPAIPGGVLKKTITQASANVSVSSGTVTVTDADITTSTIVNLYPSDSTTETWLESNLASTIITEGTGSFTFEISDTLPVTFSMYYTITEVS